jgi:hypothetical protein
MVALDGGTSIAGDAPEEPRWCWSGMRDRRRPASYRDRQQLAEETLRCTEDALGQLQDSEDYGRFMQNPSDKCISDGCGDEDAEAFVAEYFSHLDEGLNYILYLCMFALLLVCGLAVAYPYLLQMAFNYLQHIVLVAVAGTGFAWAYRSSSAFRSIVHKGVAFYLPHLLLRMLLPLILAIGLMALVCAAEAMNFSLADIVLPVTGLASSAAEYADLNIIHVVLGHFIALLFLILYAGWLGKQVGDILLMQVVLAGLNPAEFKSTCAAGCYCLCTRYWGLSPQVVVPSMLGGSVFVTTACISLWKFYKKLKRCCIQIINWVIKVMDYDFMSNWSIHIDEHDEHDEDDEDFTLGSLLPHSFGLDMVPPIATVGLCFAFDWLVASTEAAGGQYIYRDHASTAGRAPFADRDRAFVAAVAFGVLACALAACMVLGQHTFSHSATDPGDAETEHSSDLTEHGSELALVREATAIRLELRELQRESTISLVEDKAEKSWQQDMSLFFGWKAGSLIYERMVNRGPETIAMMAQAGPAYDEEFKEKFVDLQGRLFLHTAFQEQLLHRLPQISALAFVVAAIGCARPSYLYFPFMNDEWPFVYMPSGPEAITILTNPILLCGLLISYVEGRLMESNQSQSPVIATLEGVMVGVSAGVCEEVQYRWLSTPVYMVIIHLLSFFLGADTMTGHLQALKGGYDLLTMSKFSSLVEVQYKHDQSAFVFAIVLSDIEFCTIGILQPLLALIVADKKVKISVLWDRFIKYRFGSGLKAIVATFIGGLMKLSFAVWGRWLLHRHGFGALVAAHVWWVICALVLPHWWYWWFQLYVNVSAMISKLTKGLEQEYRDEND